MLRKWMFAAAAAAVLLMAGCAGSEYTRAWTWDSTSLTDTLRLSRGQFRLERASAEGLAVFTGTVSEKDDQWTFVVEAWKPTNAALQRLDPPARYVYRVKRFQGALSFMSMEVVGTSTIVFIRPGDFTAR
jgi:hypothetical protein